jgi:hypothetical protein
MNKALRAWRLLQRIEPMTRKVDKRIYKFGMISDIKRLDNLFKRENVIRKYL